MEKKIFRTILGGKFIDREFVIGRISGVMEVICHDDPKQINSFCIRQRADHIVLTTETTQDKYDKFLEIVKAWYPETNFETEIL